MQGRTIALVAGLAVVALLAGCGPRGNLTVAEKRQAVADMEKETLTRLYKEAPEAEETPEAEKDEAPAEEDSEEPKEEA